MSKSTLALIAGLLILSLSVGYNYVIKQEFNKELNSSNMKLNEIEYIKNLKSVWNSKSIKKKLENVLKSIPKNNKVLNIKRNRAEMTLNHLDTKSLNKTLSKLASLPIEIRSLNIQKSGKLFKMECKCDW